MNGMTSGIEKRTGQVAEFDLTLEYPGRWTLTGFSLSARLRYTRQHHAMGYAEFRAGQCTAMLIRLHNRWNGKSTAKPQWTRPPPGVIVPNENPL
jgi:hypothetical protein